MLFNKMLAVCTILSYRLLHAAAVSPINVAAFACTSGICAHAKRSCRQHSTKQKSNQLLELTKVGVLGKISNIDRGVIESMHDIDADLANQIEDALSSAGMADDSNQNGKYATQIFRSGRQDEATSIDGYRSMNVESSEGPRHNELELPPHTPLAQVLANQYGIDIASVSPSSKEPGAKISAEDVEYHAWMIAQPPCTPEALKMAYSMGVDLNGIYDDDDREYVMGPSDIQLYVENSRSLKMSTQVVKKGVNLDDNDTESSKKRMRKMRALDKRLEQNVVKLSDKTMLLTKTLTGGILQQILVQMQNIQRLTSREKSMSEGVFVDMMGKKVADDIQSIEDFDVDLANEIQEALSTAGELSPPSVEYNSMENELHSMTCAQLKERLRLRGLKVSGKKADLVYRLLLDCEDDRLLAQNDSDKVDDYDDGNFDSAPFFATLQ
ncbi:hypothetical protein ACHAW5_002166 [Stephanodiscus triporus]|uniref:SAP domain-containing protein n=1 Tax=Stephanodiscus triporus TaxID=2934178 RepID=A0ABD3Q3S8_9STRA